MNGIFFLCSIGLLETVAISVVQQYINQLAIALRHFAELNAYNTLLFDDKWIEYQNIEQFVHNDHDV